MGSRRHVPLPEKLLMFLEKLNRGILKRHYAQGWSFARIKS
jgi:hypothetical protein